MQHIDEAIYSIEGVEKKKKSIIPSLIILAVGILMAWKSEQLDQLLPSIEIGAALTTIGGMLAVYGLILLFMALKNNRGIPYYGGKPMKRNEDFYEGDKLQALCNAVNGKDLEKLGKITQSSTSAVIVITYNSKDGKLTAMQVLEYIPHQHVPSTEMVVF